MAAKPPHILKVALPVPVRTLFDYRLPPHHDGPAPTPGVRVRVPFGRRHLVGVVISTNGDSELPESRLRNVDRILDSKPVLPAASLNLLHWCAGYYQHAIGEVACSALPPQLRRGRSASPVTVTIVGITSAGEKTEANDLERAPRQASIMARLRKGPMVQSELLALEGKAHAALKALEDKGWIERREVERTKAKVQPQDGPSLTNEQRAAVEAIKHDAFKVTLLDGVTGSGKTEVYLQAARSLLAAGRQVLVLVPEIGLTPQFLRRIRERLGGDVAEYHSAMTPGDRAGAWWAARTGQAGVLVGTRSAVFTPMPRLGLIVVDEEHDASFKQQDGFRYNGRDVAVMRAHQEGVPLVLGSATPSLESLSNVARERYDCVHLPRRRDQPPPPPIRVADLRGTRLSEGLGELLLDHVEQHLQREGQVLLFLNRRGFAPVLMCHECGWHARCHRCEAHTTVHRKPPRLVCHHCGHTARIPVQCPECDARELLNVGEGTERLDAFLSERFPEIPVMRVDRDSTRARGSLAAIMDRARKGEPLILVGTQMLAKGHHLPRVTLAGIVNIDQALFGTDFRATERAAQLIVQVAGRAGRSDAAGEVILQTHHPDHPLIDALTRQSYAAFAQAELGQREAVGWPPFAYLALLRAEAHEQRRAEEFLQAAAELAGHISASLSAKGQVRIMGPVTAPLERIAGRYRMQLLLRSEARGAMRHFLEQWLPMVEGLKSVRQVRWSLDVDPQDMM